MSLISIYFLIFLAILIPIYYLINKNYRWIVLLVGSLAFFVLCCWNGNWLTSLTPLFFIFFATTCIFFAGLAITKNKEKEKLFFEENPEMESSQKKVIKQKNKRKRKLFLVLGIVSILVALCIVKYLNFLISNVNEILSWFNSSKQFHLVDLLLPLGISFYSFQAIGYLADLYWNKYDAENNYFKFLLFMSFFPKIIQGPIIRYDEVKPYLFAGNDFNYENFTDGLRRILWGFFKKLVIANCLFVFTKFAFSNIASLSGFEAFLAIFCYFISDYCDFSGYMDIACGSALCFGVKLPENFNHPYFSKGIDEYWRRWHITLGTWFKDYVFYPLSISKFSLNLGKKSKKIFGKFAKKIPAIFGLIVVWFLTGLWHGASWNYILWGLYFGFIIILSIIFEPMFNAFYEKTKINKNSLFLNILRHIRTLLLLAFGKILFETNSIPAACDFVAKLFDTYHYLSIENIKGTLGVISFFTAIGLSSIVLIVDLIQEMKPQTTMLEKIRTLALWKQWIITILLIVIVVWAGFYGSGLPHFEFGYQVF